jgi:4-hydroxy-4-methyl-2-oxoglutarate aldolase
MTHIVVQEIDRADPEAVAGLARHGVATIHEAIGRRGLMAPRIRPVWAGARLCGPAVTVSVPPADNWMIHVAIAEARPGDVMVVAPTSASEAGYFGDLLATLCRARGVAGLVIDAGVRDVATLSEMRFPVWSATISAQGTVKETLGDVNRAVVCAGQIVHPGDVVAADDDGVVVIPREEAAEALRQSAARAAKEAQTRARYARGELGLDINDMRPALAAKGLRWVRRP